jgi:homoserine/homoserine lactone efflux protein
MLINARFPVWLAATVLMCLSPGPNVFTTLSFALAQGFARALRSVLGVAAASAVFLVVSALGVIAALAAASTAFFVVRAAGAAYLAYLGVRLLRAALRPTGSPGPVKLTTRPFTQGFMTHISNPKAILYWGALLPQFIEPDRPVARQVVLLGTLGIVIDVGVLASYAALAAFARQRLDRPGISRVLHGIAGVFFLSTSVWLAIVSRSR